MDFGGDVVSMSPFLSASHSFVISVVFTEGDLPTRQTGGSGFVKAEGLVQNFMAFLEHLLHDEHFSGSVNPGETGRDRHKFSQIGSLRKHALQACVASHLARQFSNSSHV